MTNISLWKATAPESSYPQLNGHITVDAAIIGGGITGLSTALELTRAGMKVAVLEAWRVGEGATGYSTGNLYHASDHYFTSIERNFSEASARDAAEARILGMGFIQKTIMEQGLQCEFTPQPWHYFTEKESDISKIEDEAKAMQRAGLKAELVDTLPLPFPIKKAVMIREQARFNPMQYAKALAAYVAGGSAVIFEHTKMLKIKDKDPDSDELSTIFCETGTVKAKYVILATHTPKGFDITQTVLGPYRSYGIAAKLSDGNAYPHGSFWDTNPGSHHSITSHNGQDGRWLIVVGASHKVGQEENTWSHYDYLENYAREKFPVKETGYRWSAQHYRPADSLPYIGESETKDVYIATGFSADGLVWGSFAGMHIAQLITGVAEERWKELFKPNRFKPIASAKDFVKENINAAKYYIKDYVLKSDYEKLSHIAAGEGDIVEINGEKLAAYRDETGKLNLLSAVCPHLYCIVRWNTAEKSWDCPCHGSRFTCDGRVIEGPAIHDLKKKEVKEE